MEPCLTLFLNPTNFKKISGFCDGDQPGNRLSSITSSPLFRTRAPPGEGPERQGAIGRYHAKQDRRGFGPGTARHIKAGSSMFSDALHNGGGKDRTSIGLVFAKEPPNKTLVTGSDERAVVIPPGDGNHEVKSSTTFKEDVHLTSFMPHMHFRGKDFMYTAVYPDGRSEVLLNVPKYDFNWQLTYLPEKPIALPKGTRLDCVAHFDNSTKNKFNPDPTKEVRWGDQTWEEMMIGWFTFTRDAEQRETAVAKSPSAN
jgi:hypothetical protein